MQSLFVVTSTIFFFLAWFGTVSCIDILNRDNRGHLPLLVDQGGPFLPVNSPFYEYEEEEDDSFGSQPFDGLIRELLKPPAPLWDEEMDDGKDMKGFPFGDSNPFGLGLLGSPSRQKTGPSFFEQVFKPLTDLSAKDNNKPQVGTAPVKPKKVEPPPPTVAEMIAKNNLTWKDFIPQLKQINIPGLDLTVNLDPEIEQKKSKQPTPEETKKATKVNETIAQLNTVLKTIFPAQTNLTKIELNVGKEGKTSINMLTDGLSGHKSDDESFVSQIAGKLTSIFKGSEDQKSPKSNLLLVEPTSKTAEKDQPKENALVRFFYFFSRHSSPEGETVVSQNVSESVTAESKALPNSNDQVDANLITLMFSVGISVVLLFNMN